MIMHYTGRLTNGAVFDSSRLREMPFEFTLGAGHVIQGWEKGVATMTKGEKAVLRCAPTYAYGSSGAGGLIPPNATLEFELELIGWKESPSIWSYPAVKCVVVLLIGYAASKFYSSL
jgi:FKBP-type peptidyl-prolyl cis-trans isomerase